MGFDNKYPYTDFHELNLDWLLEKVKGIDDRFVAIEDAVAALREDLDIQTGRIDAALDAITFIQNHYPAMIASEYDENRQYDPGEIAIYDNELYIARPGETPGPWNGNYWNKTSLGDELGTIIIKVNDIILPDLTNINNVLAEYGTLLDDIVETYDPNFTYFKNNFVKYEDHIYMVMVESTNNPPTDLTDWDPVTFANVFSYYISNLNVFVPEFQDNITYHQYDYVRYNNFVYYCKDTTFSGAWDPSKWENCVLSMDLAFRMRAFYEMFGEIFGWVDSYDNTMTYDAGDYVMENGNLYRALVGVPTNTLPDSSPDYWVQVTITSELKEKPSKVGEYDNMLVGAAKGIYAGNFNDLTPYIIRSVSDRGNMAIMKKLIGGSVAFNQLLQYGNFTDATKLTANNGTATVSSGVATFTPNTGRYQASFGITATGAKNAIVDHVYLYHGYIKITDNLNKNTLISPILAQFVYYGELTPDVDTLVMGTVKAESTNLIRFFVYPWGTANNDFDGTQKLYSHDFWVTDLTQMFGTTIADYIYTLEQNTSGSGVAWFRKYFPNVYYAYSAPTIQSTKVSAKVVKDSNNTTIATYDLSGSHLVKRKYEYRAYQSGDESLADTITDGTNTVTKRVTPITETVTNPTLYGIWKLDANNNLYFDGDEISDIPNPQIVPDGGTEEYIDAAVIDGLRDVSIPAGQDTDYSEDLVKKLEDLPYIPIYDASIASQIGITLNDKKVMRKYIEVTGISSGTQTMSDIFDWTDVSTIVSMSGCYTGDDDGVMVSLGAAQYIENPSGDATFYINAIGTNTTYTLHLVIDYIEA